MSLVRIEPLDLPAPKHLKSFISANSLAQKSGVNHLRLVSYHNRGICICNMSQLLILVIILLGQLTITLGYRSET